MPHEIHDIEAHKLRLEALNLLKQAQEIDGLEPVVVVHDHDCGQTCYMGWSRPLGDDEDKKQEWAARLIEAAGNKFEEDREELLYFHEGDVGLAEVCGCDPNAEEVIEILNLSTGGMRP